MQAQAGYDAQTPPVKKGDAKTGLAPKLQTPATVSPMPSASDMRSRAESNLRNRENSTIHRKRKSSMLQILPDELFDVDMTPESAKAELIAEDETQEVEDIIHREYDDVSVDVLDREVSVALFSFDTASRQSPSLVCCQRMSIKMAIHNPTFASFLFNWSIKTNPL